LPRQPPPTPQQIANHFFEVAFTGGPPRVFEEVGRESLKELLDHGLTRTRPSSTSAAAHCASLLADQLPSAGNYCGLEPDAATLAVRHRPDRRPDVIAAKRPRSTTTAT